MRVSKKIVLLGHFGVGKSSLIRRFVENTFSEDYKVTIGVHIFKKEINKLENNNDVALIIWDLEGNDDITQTRASYLLGTDAFIFVFDITRPETYKDLEIDLQYLKTHYPNIPIKVVGNKKDLVTKEFVRRMNVKMKRYVDCFTSAKTGDDVEDVFVTLASELI